MKKIFLVFITISLCSACAVTRHSDLITGEYSGRTHWIGEEMALSLVSDETFRLHWNNIDYTGRWEISSKNHVLLRFNEITDLSTQLQSGVILDKERTVKFVNKNKIMILPYKEILKRK